MEKKFGMHRRRNSRWLTSRRWWLGLLGLLLALTWGCTAGQTNRRTAPRDKDGLPLDQYDDFAPRSNQSRQTRYRSSSGGSWLDDFEPQQPRQRAPRYRQAPRAASTPAERCLQLGSDMSQQHCLLALLNKGTTKQRSGHLKQLLRLGKDGLRAVFSLLRQSNLKTRTFVVREIMGDDIYIQSAPSNLLPSLYKVAKQDVLEGFASLPVDQRLAVATKLVSGLVFFTRKRITREFKAYLKLPAGTLWSNIRKETAMPTSMAMVSLAGCIQGQNGAQTPYNKAMLSLQYYYSVWRVWNMAADASGVRRYMRLLRLYKSGRYRHPPRARFNRKALRIAVVLARRLQQLKPKTRQAISSVKAQVPRQRMDNWFANLLSKSPKLRGKRYQRQPRSPRPRSGGRRLEL